MTDYFEIYVNPEHKCIIYTLDFCPTFRGEKMFYFHHTYVLIHLMLGGINAMLCNSSPVGADKDVRVLQQPSQDQNQPTCDHIPTVMEMTYQQASRRVHKPCWGHYLGDYIMSSSSQIVGTPPWAALCLTPNTLNNSGLQTHLLNWGHITNFFFKPRFGTGLH